MKKYIFNHVFFFLMLCGSNYLYSQDPWKLSADKPDSNNYYGETVANGMIGIISSPEPLKVKEVVLAGTYDVYKRGRVQVLWGTDLEQFRPSAGAGLRFNF